MLLQQCKPGTHRCNRRCVASADWRTCGSRCTPCPRPLGNGTATCTNGRCGIKCARGTQLRQRCSGGVCQPSCNPVPLSCPPGRAANAATRTCDVCSRGTFKAAAGTGRCVPCPLGTDTAGAAASDHDSADDCRPISCPPGSERDMERGGCKTCGSNSYKDADSPEPCTPCPPGTRTMGVAAADRDAPEDCVATPAECGPGEEPDASSASCRVCGAGTVKPEAGRQPCSPCPEGTRTLGGTPADHDSAADCVAGGLQPGGTRTGSLSEALAEFDALYTSALKNTGGKGGGGKGGTGGRGRRTRACLYRCDGIQGYSAADSTAVAYIAASPLAYRSDDPDAVRAGVSLVGPAFDQGACASCVSAAIIGAAQAAVATALRVPAASLPALVPDFGYFCTTFLGEVGPRRSCAVGWSFEPALRVMQAQPAAFFVPVACLATNNLASLSQSTQLQSACIASAAAPSCNRPAAFSCSSETLAEGVWSLQRHIRCSGGCSLLAGLHATRCACFCSHLLRAAAQAPWVCAGEDSRHCCIQALL